MTTSGPCGRRRWSWLGIASSRGLKIIQDHRLLLRRLVDSLALPDEVEESGLGPGQRHARTAANARWRERAEGNGKLAELRAAAQGGW